MIVNADISKGANTQKLHLTRTSGRAVDNKLTVNEEHLRNTMSLKLKDFARTNIESDPIRRSDESEDEDISYLPTPASGNVNILIF